MKRKRLCKGIALSAVFLAPVGAMAQTEPPVPPEQARGGAPSTTTAPGETPPATQPEPTPRPLIGLLGQTPIGEALGDARINIFGHAEASWTHNFTSGGRLLPGRVFDIENDDPTLNQIDLTVERSVELNADHWDFGGRVEFIWGGDPRFIHSLGLFDYQGFDNGTDNQFDLNQAYVDINAPVGNGLRVRMGKFVTLLGYEVINPTGNPLYSHSYMFGYAIPFTHTGIVATYKVNDQLTVNAGVTRGWDTTLEDNNGALGFLGSAAFTLSDKTAFSVNVVAGPDQAGNNNDWRTVIDAVLTHKISDDLTVGLNADYGYEADSAASVSGSDAQWFGVAGYLSKTLNKSLTLNARAEYFNDQDGARISGTSTSWYEATLGVAIKPMPDDPVGQNLVLRPEVRFDYAEEPVFNGDYNQFTFGIDAYFTF